MELKVLQYNIQHGLDYKKLKQKERVIDLNKICDVINEYNPDIISLNEVYNDVYKKETCNQVKYIAENLGYKYYYFGKSITIKETIDYGNAIISRYPIKNIKVHMIEDPIIKDEDVWYETRSIIECDVEIKNELLRVFVTHLGLAKSEQKNGIDKLLSLIDNKKTIIMGDFNMEEENDNIIKLTKVVNDTSSLMEGNKLTFTTLEPTMKIDYVLYKNIKCIKARVIKKVVSDHFPVFAIFIIN